MTNEGTQSERQAALEAMQGLREAREGRLSLLVGPQARYKGKTNAGSSAMANDTLINLLAWCKRERERLQMQREMLQSGRFRIFEKDDSGQQRDISNQHIEQIAANIAELDRIIIADYGAKSV